MAIPSFLLGAAAGAAAAWFLDPNDGARRRSVAQDKAMKYARKGAAEDFDHLLDVDARWRALQPRIDELRSQGKLKGKPTPEQLAALTPARGSTTRAWRPRSRARSSGMSKRPRATCR